MERPSYDKNITRQNDGYAMSVIERFRPRPKTGATLLSAITEAFILGAGGYEGDFDAAMTLEYGGLDILLQSLGLPDIDKNLSEKIDDAVFKEAIRASVDFGASWDDLEDEIPCDSIADTDITGSLLGPLAVRFVYVQGESNRPDWRTD